VHDTLFQAFGDFANTSKFDKGLDWFFFVLATLIICLIMMNLFIGILGEKLSEILENKEKSNYCELCSIIYLLENYIYWFSENHIGTQQKAIIITADKNYKQEDNAWNGRVAATTKPIVAETKKLKM
jgi:hypothetical protein